MLSMDSVNQFYGESHTLWDLSIDIPQGSRTCLMGRNGVGKTTALKCVMGLLPIRGGAIHFNDTLLSEQAAERRAPLGIGYVPQGRDIFPRLTVGENLKVGFSVRPITATNRAYERVFELFPALRDMLNRSGGDLSGGQQQQLAIARALILEPELLILDEPTEGIQPNIVHEIGEVIVRLNQEESITVLLIEQKLPLARRIADRFCIMDKGRLVAKGAIDELTDDIIRAHLTV